MQWEGRALKRNEAYISHNATQEQLLYKRAETPQCQATALTRHIKQRLPLSFLTYL